MYKTANEKNMGMKIKQSIIQLFDVYAKDLQKTTITPHKKRKGIVKKIFFLLNEYIKALLKHFSRYVNVILSPLITKDGPLPFFLQLILFRLFLFCFE